MIVIRILCVECDIGTAVNIGGPVEQKGKSFDIDCPDLEAWLSRADMSDGAKKWVSRSVAAVEVRGL